MRHYVFLAVAVSLLMARPVFADDEKPVPVRARHQQVPVPNRVVQPRQQVPNGVHQSPGNVNSQGQRNYNPNRYPGAPRNPRIYTPANTGGVRVVTPAPPQLPNVATTAANNANLEANRRQWSGRNGGNWNGNPAGQNNANNGNANNQAWRNRENGGSGHDWQKGHGNGDNNNWNQSHWDHHRNWDRHHRNRNWWRSHYTRFAVFGGGYYYLNSGYWYPAYGYDPTFDTYSYDAPIYAYNDQDPGQVIATVQTELLRRGYDCGSADGTYGPSTRQALLDYQQDNGLPVTGEIDEATLDSLGLQ